MPTVFRSSVAIQRSNPANDGGTSELTRTAPPYCPMRLPFFEAKLDDESRTYTRLCRKTHLEALPRGAGQGVTECLLFLGSARLTFELKVKRVRARLHFCC